MNLGKQLRVIVVETESHDRPGPMRGLELLDRQGGSTAALKGVARSATEVEHESPISHRRRQVQPN